MEYVSCNGYLVAMTPVQIPEGVREALNIEMDLDGFRGVIPGHLHFPSLLNTRQGLWSLFKSACYGLFVVLVMMFTRGRKVSDELILSGGSPTRTVKRGADTTFQISETRCSVDGQSWAWTDILFIRLVPPALHSTRCTLQIFERNGPEHRWALGADNFKEVTWLVGLMKRLKSGSRREMSLPEELHQLIKQAGSGGSAVEPRATRLAE